MIACSVSSCPAPAVVAVTFTTGGRLVYCRRHAFRHGHPVWKPWQIISVDRLDGPTGVG